MRDVPNICLAGHLPSDPATLGPPPDSRQRPTCRFPKRPRFDFPQPATLAPDFGALEVLTAEINQFEELAKPLPPWRLCSSTDGFAPAETQTAAATPNAPEVSEPSRTGLSCSLIPASRSI
jgi:hypothetical protein